MSCSIAGQPQVAATLFVLSETGATHSQHQAAPLRAPLPLQMPLQDKHFYLLSLIERTPSVATVVKTDPGLAAIFHDRLTAVESAETECKGDVPRCTVRNALLTPEEIDAAGKRLEALYERDAGVRGLVAGPMRQSGLFELYRNEDDRTLLVHAWTDAAQDRVPRSGVRVTLDAVWLQPVMTAESRWI